MLDAKIDLGQQIRALGYEMVWLEEWAREAYLRHEWERVGELHQQREETQQQRSNLLRELLARQGGRRIREALRQA